MKPLVRVRELTKQFPLRGTSRVVHAVNQVSFDIIEGSSLGLVGESGSGKSTVGRCVLRLLESTSGSVHYGGIELSKVKPRRLRALRAEMQIVFQDPYQALNPRMRIVSLVEEPLRLRRELGRAERRDTALGLLGQVGLSAKYADRRPRELSGGELQRVCIARALACSPRFVVLDEPTSSLDASVRSDILSLLAELRSDLKLTYLLISHDLPTVADQCDQIAVMYLGTIVEQGPAQALLKSPQHPYTQALLSSFLPADPFIALSRHVLKGEIPSSIEMPPGCPFASRCPLVVSDCLNDMPAQRSTGTGRWARCIRIDDGTNILPSTSEG